MTGECRASHGGLHSRQYAVSEHGRVRRKACTKQQAKHNAQTSNIEVSVNNQISASNEREPNGKTARKENAYTNPAALSALALLFLCPVC